MKMKFGVLAGAIVAVMMGVSGQAMAGTDEEQLARMADPDQWPAPGRDFALTRHSTLADINTKNIGKLQMIWLQGTNALRGHEGQPLVIKDVGGKTMLFMVSGCPAMSNCNVVQALDLSRREQSRGDAGIERCQASAQPAESPASSGRAATRELGGRRSAGCAGRSR